jgi:hypothetical protein
MGTELVGLASEQMILLEANPEFLRSTSVRECECVRAGLRKACSV